LAKVWTLEMIQHSPTKAALPFPLTPKQTPPEGITVNAVRTQVQEFPQAQARGGVGERLEGRGQERLWFPGDNSTTLIGGFPWFPDLDSPVDWRKGGLGRGQLRLRGSRGWGSLRCFPVLCCRGHWLSTGNCNARMSSGGCGYRGAAKRRARWRLSVPAAQGCVGESSGLRLRRGSRLPMA
jgi:hypothetical protein